MDSRRVNPNCPVGDIENNEGTSFHSSSLRNEILGLQQKRGKQERLRLNLPRQVVSSSENPSSYSVHFADSEANSIKQSFNGNNCHRKIEIEEPTPKCYESISKTKAKLLNLDWIPANCNSICLRPIIRCSIFAWISLLLILVPRTQKFLGKASEKYRFFIA